MDHMVALKVFRTVVEQGSFANAGKVLQLSPAAISKNIGELERHVQARLLNRTTRRMSLTEAGSIYYQQVRRILDDIEDADRSLGALQSKPSGLLRVTAPVSLTLLTLSPAIPAFLARYPELSLDLNLDDRRIDIVKDGYDVAIRGSDSLEESSLVARRLFTLDHVVCGSPEYVRRRGAPEQPDDLRRHDCVQFTLSGHADEWTFRRGGAAVRVPIDGRYKVTSGIAVRDALLAGFGLSLVPRRYVADDLARGTLSTVLEDWSAVETPIYAVYPSRRYLVPKVRAFVDFAIDVFTSTSSGPGIPV
ncbi:LysR family transcriptional regulator [Inquilinus sp. Marseille-Q2685]|uniref:LysR family transcriptional regulator n=1 Tax=Inquilinus sp. Marseille-Q2685 TaxID=2866581 RepID=UPI001CE3FE94|nr:LysR family transcriptional regulator [Inquilinus sp. Marseille-Q2685]